MLSKNFNFVLMTEGGPFGVGEGMALVKVGTPWLSKSGNSSMREILVITSSHDRPFAHSPFHVSQYC